MTKKESASKYGERSVWCREYGRCLDQAIESGAGGFSCQGCQYQGDRRGLHGDDAERREDAAACLALLLAAYRRIKREHALNLAHDAICD